MGFTILYFILSIPFVIVKFLNSKKLIEYIEAYIIYNYNIDLKLYLRFLY